MQLQMKTQTSYRPDTPYLTVCTTTTR